MSIQTQITRITNDKDTIKAKLVTLGLATSSDNLDTLAAAVNGIANRGIPDAEVKEGETYTIEAGYYKGGTVRGVAGGGHYELQTKEEIIPTKQAQTITPDDGYYGLASVEIEPIPDAYQDVSSVTAAAGDVLAGKNFVPSDGTLTAGTMVNNGAVDETLDVANTSYSVPVGYHNGSGTVKIVTETKTATPTEAEQTISATTGKVLASVTVNAIPDNYVNLDNYDETDAVAANVLVGKTAYGKDDEDGFFEIEGSMPNNGAQSATLDVNTDSKTIPAGYTTGGTVSVASESKSTTPTKQAQTISGTNGKFLTSVSVAAIPDNYGDVTSADADASHILAGKKAVLNVDGDAELVTGTMANNGTITGSIDGLTSMSYSVPAGYTSGGTVTLTSDIEDALALI